MRTAPRSLERGRALRAAVASLLVVVLATILTSGVPATGAAVDPIDVPMTGNLPACPAGMASFSPSAVWANNHQHNRFGTSAELGLKNNCAYQNWIDPDDTSSFPRAADVRAAPETISISSEPVTITVQASPLDMPGPYNAFVPSCQPWSTRQGGCASTGASGYYVGYRLANGSGQFVGKWTLAGVHQPNPYFDITRGSCPDNYPEWSAGYEHTGLPCVWTVNFVTNAQGAPVLTQAMQVIVSVLIRSTTETTGQVTGPAHSTPVVVPMVFEPGASTGLDLRTSANSIPSGATLHLTALAQGPEPGTPVNFYRLDSENGWSFLGQAVTDATDQATLPVKVSTTATYRARLVSGGVETTQSPQRTVIATRAVNLQVRHLDERRFRFIGTVQPDEGVGKAKLQTLTERGWKSMKRAAVDGGRVSWVISVPRGESSWRLITRATPLYGKSASRTRSVTAVD